MTRRSIYEFRRTSDYEQRLVHSAQRRQGHLFVYPFIKTRLPGTRCPNRSASA